jgi:anti-sigma B factor antagonist
MSLGTEVEQSAVHVHDATDAITVLDLEGEFDIFTAPTIIEHAERALADNKHLIVNLSDATFIDSSIIHALFQASDAAKSADRVFVLQFGTHPAVERVLSITAADKELNTAPTRADAIDLIKQRTTHAATG